MKIALCVAYDGCNYSGWQRQADTQETVQAKLESALSYVADDEVTVFCAGRTDAGVHALAQIAHFETDAQRSGYNWQRGTNTQLPDDISIRRVYEVSDEFHARFSANRRSYTYIIDNTPLSPLSINRQRTAWIYEPLDVDHMNIAANCLLGEHDFSAFRSSTCQAKTPVKTIHELEIQRIGEHVIMRIAANAFLHHMVRNIAGVLIEIGAGNQSPEWCQQVLTGCNRCSGGITAPASGLYLTGVGYPDEFKIDIPKADIVLAT